MALMQRRTQRSQQSIEDVTYEIYVSIHIQGDSEISTLLATMMKDEKKVK